MPTRVYLRAGLAGLAVLLVAWATIMLVVVAWAITPRVQVSWSTGECVHVDDPEYSCESLPARYETVWVQ